MKFKIVEPTKAYVSCSPEELEALKRALTYTNTSVSFQLRKLMKQKWFEINRPVEWKEKYDKLTAEVKKTLVFKDAGGVFIRPGSMSYLPFQFEVENQIIYPDFKTIAWAKKPPFEPYKYQLDAVQAMLSAKHGAVSLPTGAGKTLCLQLLTRQLGGKVAIVVPTKGIFLEVLTSFEESFGRSKVGAFGNGKKDIKRDITVAIAKSVSMVKPGSKEADFFAQKSAFIFDEAHMAAATELEKISHNVVKNAPYRLFLSGTQTRGDGAIPLLQSITGPIVYSMTTKDGIAQGALSPLEFRIISVPPGVKGFDSSDAAAMKRQHILYNPHVIKKAAEIANNVVTKMGENVLILVEEIEQMALVAKELNVPFTYTHGNTTPIETLKKLGLEKTDLKEALEKFHKKIDGTMVLIGTENISIGVNTFAHHGINLQGGASEIGTKQGIIGRMVRITQNSKYTTFHKEKKIARVWDFRITPTIKENGDVIEYKLLERHLGRRIKFYKETGGKIIEIT